MKTITLIPILIMALLTLACSVDEGAPDESVEKTETQASGLAIPDSPCDWINAEDIRSLLNIESEFEISMEAKDYTFPACSFRWEDGQVVKNMEVGGREMTVDMPSEIMVVLAKEVNAAKFERSTAVYKDGVAVDGLGDEAMWGKEMSQLSFRKGSIMMHVNVQIDNDSSINKSKAVLIAKFLLGKM